MSSNEFSRRFDYSEGPSSRPDCYGDPDEYDRDDSICRDCRHNRLCELMVTKKQREQGKTSSYSRPSYRSTAEERTKSSVKRRGTTDYQEMDCLEDDTFAGVLVHNASLNALQGLADTLSGAVAQLPRKTYPNPFSRVKDRKKV